MMQVAIVGYGRMGHEIARIAEERGHEIALVVDPSVAEHDDGTGPRYATGISEEALAGCDVAIEFSFAEAVVPNVATYAAAGVAAVIGTTGWYDRLDEVSASIHDHRGALVYGANYSIGAHLFFRAAASTAALVRDLEEYDVAIHEMHHREKRDSPSGTSLSLARAVLDAVPRKRFAETGRLDRPPEPEEMHVTSTRCGSVPGTHTLVLDSPADTIEVTHRARNRSGFALGAVRAAEWIVDQKGLFTVEQFVDELLGHNR
ncbi:MAG: 4-hydroxy-tetrahydrodipicolinate reductase [Spirochaetota bacterium]